MSTTTEESPLKKQKVDSTTTTTTMSSTTTTDSDIVSKWEDAVTAMTKPENRFDVTIICTTDDHQAEFWMNQLSSSSTKTSDDNGEESSSKYPMVLAVSEDWNSSSGAGNGLGTLYAWKKAMEYAKTKYGNDIDLEKDLLDGKISAALYHTAGKGTRLAPLPASENNNKPGVKLPFINNETKRPWTVLEAVVRQTGIYAPSRKGRLSVFWGDQVFVPSVDFTYKPTHHIDILCTLLGDTAPTAEEWKEQGLDKYGVIAVLQSDDDKPEGTAAQVEKVDHSTATKMLQGLGTIKQVGPSLGSFSVSGIILKALIQEYTNELTKKEDKLDTDPHFWMPLTLSEKDYIYLMTQKGIDEETSKKHYQRMDVFSKKFKEEETKLGLFGAVNVGKDACWWDYGQLKLYSKNSFLLLENTTEAKLLRKFVGVTDDPTKDDNSYIFDSSITSNDDATTTIKDSIVCRVTTKELNTNNSLIVNCIAPKITTGKGCILYNIISDKEINVKDGEVHVQVTTLKNDGDDDDDTTSSFVLKSRMDIDGGKAWKIKVENNEQSFEDVHKNNKETNISKVEQYRQDEYTKLSKTL